MKSNTLWIAGGLLAIVIVYELLKSQSSGVGALTPQQVAVLGTAPIAPSSAAGLLNFGSAFAQFSSNLVNALQTSAVGGNPTQPTISALGAVPSLGSQIVQANLTPGSFIDPNNVFASGGALSAPTPVSTVVVDALPLPALDGVDVSNILNTQYYNLLNDAQTSIGG